MQARFVRAMKAIQQKVSINELALALHNSRHEILSDKTVAQALTPVKSAVVAARQKGGALGAQKVRDLGKR